MLASAGITTIIVSKIIFICFACLIYLKTLDILIALMKVVEEPKSACILIETHVEMIEVMTMMKSKVFPVSRKYARWPNAKSLRKDSTAKIIANE